MLEVKIENIIPVTEARDSFNQLVDKVENSDEMYVLTKNGKPAVIIVGIKHLEKLTGEKNEELMKGLTPMSDDNVQQAVDPAAAPVAGASTTTPPADEDAIEEASTPTVTPVEDAEEEEEEIPASTPPATTSGDSSLDSAEAPKPADDPFAMPDQPADTAGTTSQPATPPADDTNSTPPAPAA